jgi:transposase
LRPLENFLELLIRAGCSPAGALHAYRLFFGFLHGHILDELQDLIDNPDEADDLLRLGLHRLPRREFPRIRSLAPELASYDGAAHLQQGVALMITGLQSHFQPAPTHQPHHLNSAATSLPAVPQTHRHRRPGGLELHLICDNYATRKTPAIKKWLLRHPRPTCTSPPTSSWNNLVELWFAELTNRKRRRSAHRSVTRTGSRQPQVDQRLVQRPQAIRACKLRCVTYFELFP